MFFLVTKKIVLVEWNKLFLFTFQLSLSLLSHNKSQMMEHYNFGKVKQKFWKLISKHICFLWISYIFLSLVVLTI